MPEEQRDTRSTRTAIVNAMYDLIAEYGYDGASLSKLCEVVGITKASIYYYFKSKEEILLAVYDSLYFSRTEASDFSEANDSQAYQKRFIEMGDHYISELQDNPERRKVLAELELQTTRVPLLTKYAEERNAQMLAALDEIVKLGVKLHAFDEKLDARLAAESIYVFMNGMSQTYVWHDGLDQHTLWRLYASFLFSK